MINGSGSSPRYRGTKLRANLPQPYINPDFLRLLSQRSPSSSSSSSTSPSPSAPHSTSRRIPPGVQYNEPRGMHHPVSIIRSLGIQPNYIKIRTDAVTEGPKGSGNRRCPRAEEERDFLARGRDYLSSFGTSLSIRPCAKRSSLSLSLVVRKVLRVTS